MEAGQETVLEPGRDTRQERRLLTLKEAAEFTGVRERWLREHWRELGGTKVFGPLKFFPEVIMERFEAAKQEAQERALREAERRAALQDKRRGFLAPALPRLTHSLPKIGKCGAITKKGTPCPHKAKEGQRCAMHGGPSIYDS